MGNLNASIQVGRFAPFLQKHPDKRGDQEKGEPEYALRQLFSPDGIRSRCSLFLRVQEDNFFRRCIG